MGRRLRLPPFFYLREKLRVGVTLMDSNSPAPSDPALVARAGKMATATKARTWLGLIKGNAA